MDPINKNLKIEFMDEQDMLGMSELSDRNAIAQAIQRELIDNSGTPYLKVAVRPVYYNESEVMYYVAYLINKHISLFEAVKFEINSNGTLKNVIRNYDDADDYDQNITGTSDTLGADDYEFVAGTAFPEVPTAVKAVNDMVAAATTAGLKAIALIGKDATIANYKKYLTAKLKGFCNVGHGNDLSILLHDGSLSYKWFNTLAASDLKPEVIYFNSCQTFKDPLGASVTTHGSRTYIAGKVDLPIPTSEQMSASFWQTILGDKNALMGATLTQKMKDFGLVDYFGLNGDAGKFTVATSVQSVHHHHEKVMA